MLFSPIVFSYKFNPALHNQFFSYLLQNNLEPSVPIEFETHCTSVNMYTNLNTCVCVPVYIFCFFIVNCIFYNKPKKDQQQTKNKRKTKKHNFDTILVETSCSTNMLPVALIPP